MAKSKYWKHPQYGITYCNQSYVTPPCRIAWPALVTPKDPPPPRPGEQAGLPRYEVTLLFPKKSTAHRTWLKAIGTVFNDMLGTFNEGRPAKLSGLEIVKDGDDSEKFDPEKYPYYSGQHLLVARNTKLPSYMDGKKRPVDPSKIMGGCEVCAIVTPIITSSGPSYKLEMVQLWKDDGVRYGGGPRTDFVSMLEVAEDYEEPTEETVEEASEEESLEEAADEILTEVAKVPAAKPGKRGKANIANLL